MKRHEEAFNYYVEGLEYPAIAEKFGVSRKTIGNWVKKYNWVDRRKEIIALYEKTYIDTILQRAEKAAENMFEFGQICSELGLKFIKGVKRKTANAAKNNRASPLEDANMITRISKWTKIMHQTSTMYKNCMPDLDEEIANKVVAELEKRSEAREEIEEVKSENSQKGAA